MNKQKIIVKSRRLIYLAVGVFVLFAMGFWLMANNKTVTTPSLASVPTKGMVFYYGDTCPHCAKVEAYLKERPNSAKLELVQKEVYNSQTNQAELVATAKLCGIAANRVGVPLLYTGGRCLVGDIEIIAYFKQILE